MAKKIKVRQNAKNIVVTIPKAIAQLKDIKIGDYLFWVDSSEGLILTKEVR